MVIADAAQEETWCSGYDFYWFNVSRFSRSLTRAKLTPRSACIASVVGLVYRVYDNRNEDYARNSIRVSITS